MSIRKKCRNFSLKQVTYETFGREEWVVERYSLLEAFRITRAALPLWHEKAKRIGGVPWELIRRYAGLHPAAQKPGDNPALFRAWNRSELEKEFNMTRRQLDTQFEVLTKTWLKHVIAEESNKQREEEITVPKTPAPHQKRGETRWAGLEIPRDADAIALPVMKDKALGEMLVRYGFGDGIFGGKERELAQAEAEREWFALRVMEFQKLFEEPAAATMIRQALMNELFSKRLESKLCLIDPASAAFDLLSEKLQSFQEAYRKQWEDLNKIVPFASQVNNKTRVAGVLGDFVSGMQAHLGRKDNRVLDGLLTGYDIEVAMRTTQPMDMRYQRGNLEPIFKCLDDRLDATWRQRLPKYMAAMMEAGNAEAQKRASMLTIQASCAAGTNHEEDLELDVPLFGTNPT